MKKMIKMLWMTLILGVSVNVFANSQDLGTVVGGIAGGILGNNIGHGSGRTAATIGGAVVGGLVGNQMGRNSDAAARYHSGCYNHSHWDSYQTPCYNYPPRYPYTFIGRDGRLCRRSVFVNEFGERLVVTSCCYRMSPQGYCTRWVRMY